MKTATRRSLLPFALAATLACATAQKTAESSPGASPAAAAKEAPATPASVTPISLHADARLGIEIARGELKLPAAYPFPRLTPAPGEAGVAHLYVFRPGNPGASREARRQQAEQRRMLVDRPWGEIAGSYELREALRCYGVLHGGVGPTRLDETDWIRCVARTANGPYDLAAPLPPPPPYEPDSGEAQAVAAMAQLLTRFALVPKTPLAGQLLAPDGEVVPVPVPDAAPAKGKAKGKGKASAKAAAPAAPEIPLDAPSAPLFVEVAPAADDGRHWVLDNGLRPGPARVAIDAGLLARTGVTLRKDAVLPAPEGADDAGETVTWEVYAQRRKGAKEVRLELQLERGAPVRSLTWAVGVVEAKEDGAVLRRWAGLRLGAMDLLRSGDGPLQEPILASAFQAYRLEEDSTWGRLAGRRERGRSDGGPSLLALFGGRAAVDETLQLGQGLATGMAAPEAGQGIPLAELPGVEVQAHPWKELLAGRAAPRVPLAELVPVDRSLIYLPQPKEAVEAIENGGSGFLNRVSSFAREGRLDYAVVERYLQTLGLGDGLGRKLLKAGAIQQAAIFTPDLSFLSGTDVTVVAQVSGLFEPLLPIGDGELQEKATAGGKCWRARRGSLVFLSTSRAELEKALALHAAAGAGSMGKSDEFAFMLLQLAPTERTQAFAFLSDPFIRRVVGPEVRIAQARRDAARARMEQVAGAAFLRRLDAPTEVATAAQLKELGYLHPEFPVDGLTLSPDGRVSDATFGPLERLTPASRLDVSRVSPDEAEAYSDFRSRYTQFWRKFFDPIAVRLDTRDGDGYALETFILPLVNSSIYREAKEELALTATAGRKAPRWSFPPTVAMTLQLPDKLADQAKHDIDLPGEVESTFGDVVEAMLQTVVPSLHLAFPDSAPIMQVGGGSAFGVTASNLEQVGQAGAALLIAAVTRPMVMAVELKDPERVQRALDRVVLPYRVLNGNRREIDVSLAREESGRLILSVDLFGMVKLRQSVRIEDRWLVLSNDTTLPAKLVDGVLDASTAVASVAFQPSAIKAGLPSAWHSAVEAEADAAWTAQHWFAPWLAAGATVEEAQRASRATFGAAPLLAPDALTPTWNNFYENRRFGSPGRPRIPAQPAGDFGLLEGVSKAQVEMSFEGDGLRTRVFWTR
jgi:hypothetical protein